MCEPGRFEGGASGTLGWMGGGCLGKLWGGDAAGTALKDCMSRISKFKLQIFLEVGLPYEYI